MKNIYHIQIQEAFINLKSFKEQNNKEAFKNKFMELLPALKQYIKNSIERAEKKELLKKQGYSVDDFVNDLYLYVYDHINELQNQKDFHIWIYKAIDKLIEDALVDEEFGNFFFKDIEEYSKPEWDAMEEEFSTDGDGDLVMLEELDDTSLKNQNYELNDIFVDDNENEITAKLENDLSKKRINTHIHMILNKLPMKTQSVFDLNTLGGFSTKEIAHIKHMQIQEVNKLLEEGLDIVKSSFKSRFLR